MDGVRLWCEALITVPEERLVGWVSSQRRSPAICMTLCDKFPSCGARSQRRSGFADVTTDSEFWKSPNPVFSNLVLAAYFAVWGNTLTWKLYSSLAFARVINFQFEVADEIFSEKWRSLGCLLRSFLNWPPDTRKQSGGFVSTQRSPRLRPSQGLKHSRKKSSRRHCLFVFNSFFVHLWHGQQ